MKILNRNTWELIIDVKNIKTDLEGANLKYANLEGANLKYANLKNANLEYANLKDANLEYANLWDANLKGANLKDANLWGANLKGANLKNANLEYANLSGANLEYANLWDANLWDADLRNANLWGANLWGANLRGAYLRDANLWGAKLPYFSILPEGSIIGYKKINGFIVKLFIPKKSKRVSSLIGRKCRCEYAKVLSISDGSNEIVGGHDSEFRYTVGEYVYPDKFDDDIRIECTNGIHFFITKEEAENY